MTSHCSRQVVFSSGFSELVVRCFAALAGSLAGDIKKKISAIQHVTRGHGVHLHVWSCHTEDSMVYDFQGATLMIGTHSNMIQFLDH